MTSPPSDHELMRAHVAGDRAAWARIVERHQDWMWHVASVMLPNPADAEIALSDALESARVQAHTFRFEGRLAAWLRTIVFRCCLDRLDRPTTVPLEWDVPVGHGAAEAHDRRMDVLAALARLPRDMALPIFLVDVAGWSLERVADMEGVPVGRIAQRRSRGKKRLAVLLGNYRPRSGDDRGDDGLGNGPDGDAEEVRS